jgi:hypothetical protein
VKIVISFKDLKDILSLTIKWEGKLKDFYDVAEFALSNDESKKAISALRSNLLKNLDVLKNIDLKNYGKTEWVRYASDYKDDELIPIRKVTRDSTPEEIFSQILEYQTKLKEFYSMIVSKLISIKQRELFESLVTFKDEQIFETKRFMESFISGK